MGRKRPSNMMSEKAQVEMYDRTGNMPLAWFVSAEQLLAAARILRKKRDSYDPSGGTVGKPVPDEGKILFAELMLRGFALECLLKGLWVKAGRRRSRRWPKKSINARDHDLEDAPSRRSSPPSVSPNYHHVHRKSSPRSTPAPAASSSAHALE